MMEAPCSSPPTGIAARNLSCATIHSFFELPCEPLLDTKAFPSHECLERLRACEVLIIDEISMVRSDIFTEMDRRMRLAKDRDLPFGGIPVTVCGDFHQLPPVVEDALLGEALRETFGGVFAFETKAWADARFQTCILKQQVRQADDPEFLELLNAIRTDGAGIMVAIAQLNQRVMRREKDIPVLCCRRAEVRAINQSRLEELAGPVVTFKAYCQVYLPSEQIGKDLHDLPCDEELVLKRNCEVMVLRNQPNGCCVNGERGVIESWNDDAITVRLQNNHSALLRREEWPVLAYGLDKDRKLEIQHVASVWQFPLAAGYATTIHKAQGTTLARVHIDIGRGCWEPGQLYVALSRVRRLADLTLEKELGYFDVMPTGGIPQRLKSMEF